jgi:hypothetical protein
MGIGMLRFKGKSGSNRSNSTLLQFLANLQDHASIQDDSAYHAHIRVVTQATLA